MRSACVAAVALGLVVGACGGRTVEPAAAEVAVPPMPNADGPRPAPTNRVANRCVQPLAAAAPSIPGPAPAHACPPEPSPQLLPIEAIAFPETSPAVTIDAEIADTPDAIERGLMYRRSMSDHAGMLFKLGERRVHTFWMHNTCIPLDMLFVDTDGLIVGIVEGAAPLTDAIRSIGCASAYVLEVNGGWSRKHNVTPGQRITIPN